MPARKIKPYLRVHEHNDGFTLSLHEAVEGHLKRVETWEEPSVEAFIESGNIVLKLEARRALKQNQEM